MLSADDRAAVSAAIAAAERQTSGEIVAVIAPASSRYASVPPLLAALTALLVPWPLIIFTWMPVQTIYLVQLAAFGLVLLAAWPSATRLWFVPQAVQQERAHQRAVEQFVAQNLYTTRQHTGVLIFVSAAERYAEIISDTRIYGKVPKDTWDGIVATLTGEIGAGRPAAGFAAAIAAVGSLLAEHYPPGERPQDELPDHLIILD